MRDDEMATSKNA